MLGLKIVTELKLTFDGFVDEKASALNELKFFGMALVHQHPFKLRVDKIVEREQRRTRWLLGRSSSYAESFVEDCEEDLE